MKKYTLIICIALSAVLYGCVEEESGSYWGETTYFDDFLWNKHEPVKMEQTLVFDFNEDAQRLLQDAEFSFKVEERNTEGEFVRAADITLYAKGEKCDSNVFKITVKDKELPLCVIFNDDAREGNHTLFLREVGNNSLSRVEYTELGEGFVVKKTDCVNPLKLGLIWFLIVFACILVVWILIVKFVISPASAFRKVTIIYPDGEENIIRMKSAHKLVCTNKMKKCSFWKTVFWEKVVYESNEYWTSPTTIMTGRKRNDVKIFGRDISVVNDETIRREAIILINDTTNEKVTLETN